MTRMSDGDLQRRIETLERELAELKREQTERHRDLYPQEHLVLIHVRGLETSRECYCWATGGRDHYESESPWIGQDDMPVTV